jgi:hypothetical protein
LHILVAVPLQQRSRCGLGDCPTNLSLASKRLMAPMCNIHPRSKLCALRHIACRRHDASSVYTLSCHGT